MDKWNITRALARLAWARARAARVCNIALHATDLIGHHRSDTIVSVNIFFDRSLPTLLSTILPLQQRLLHIQLNIMCDVFRPNL